MGNLAVKTQVSAIEAALVQNDLSRLSEPERLSYYKQVCESLGLNPLTQPFSYINLNGKLTLYAKRDAADQLRKLHNVSITITRAELVGEIFIVSAKASMPDGRTDESTGAVPIHGLKGDALANAYLKCETKAKRRVTLSICGMGFLDETEVETIENAKPVEQAPPPKAQKPIPNLAPGASNDDEIPETFKDDGIDDDLGNYVCPIGRKYKGQRLKDINSGHLLGYINWLQGEASEQGKELTGDFKEFVETAQAYLNQGNM